jgi:4-alpha-glucanotransferase
LPGRYGIGDLGAEAHRFVEFLHASGQSIWQVLPLGPTGYGDSPYQCFSAFAGNPLLVSPDTLVDENLLDAADLDGAPSFDGGQVDYGAVIKFKDEMLRRAFERFQRTPDDRLRAEFAQFHQASAAWLDDYALFRAIKDAQGGKSWLEWEPAFRHRDAGALAHARETLRDEIEAQRFYQFLFFRQWNAVRAQCHRHNIRIVGDIPIFVAFDSADVWTNPHLFKLNDDGSPRVVAGVPPDYFSKTGQLWGNPIYDWDRMRGDGFAWWTARVRATLSTVDILRLDHFRGFAACWEVPGGDETAERGQWVEAPGRDLFNTLRYHLGDLPILAEDLGVITPDVESLRDDFGFPGMRILQFAFGGDARNHDFRITTSATPSSIPAHTTTIRPSAGSRAQPEKALRAMLHRSNANRNSACAISTPTGARFTGISYAPCSPLCQISQSFRSKMFWAQAHRRA